MAVNEAATPDVDPEVARAVGEAFLRAASGAGAAGNEELKATVQTHNAGQLAREVDNPEVGQDQVPPPVPLSADQVAHLNAHPEDFQLHNAGRPARLASPGHGAALPASQPFAVGDEPEWFRQAAKARELANGVAPDVAYAEVLAESYRLVDGRWYGPPD